MHEPTLGSLFSGCGGLDLGLERGAGLDVRWQCQYDPDSKREQPCNGILERHWPGVPNLGDITAVDWAAVEPVDVLAGGFPCQDLSYAGRGAGIADGTRSRLWFEFAHAIRALRPRVVVVENVPGLVTRGLGVVLANLAEAGYDASWGSIRAADVGAPHRRERVFVVAADAERLRVDADRRLRGGGQGEHAGPARAAVSAGSEVACAADAVADRADATADAGGMAGTSAGELDGGPGARSLPQACGDAREAIGGVARRDSGGSEAPADASSERRDQRTHDEGERSPGGGRVAGDGEEAAADAERGAQRRPRPSEVSRAEGTRAGEGAERQRLRADAGDGDATAAHADGEHAEPGLRWRVAGSTDARAGAQEHDGDGHMGASEQGAVEWGVYDGAVRQWEAIFGYLAPRPTDDRGRLAPEFVEWMLGYPAGWVTDLVRPNADPRPDRISRTQALKMLGNSVQVQVAEVVGVAVAISLEATA